MLRKIVVGALLCVSSVVSASNSQTGSGTRATEEAACAEGYRLAESNMKIDCGRDGIKESVYSNCRSYCNDVGGRQSCEGTVKVTYACGQPD